MSLPSSSRVALVTGAAQGIGRSIALALAREGADLVLNDLEKKALAPVEAEIFALGRQALSVAADVSDPAAVETVFTEALRHFGALHTVVSNAAINHRERVADADLERFRRVLEVNQLGLVHVCQQAARHLRDPASRADAPETSDAGSILIISSVHGRVPFEGNAAYAMSKAAANQFTRVLAKELLPHGIRVNAIAPGWTDTPGERRHFSEAELQAGGRRLPMGRLATPEEIAEAAVFLTSERARYITGTILDVDGGFQIAPECIAPQG